jgi:hypothetical protein
MKLSTLLILLGGLLAATTVSWSHVWRLRQSFDQLYRDAKAGKLRSSRYARIVAFVSLALIIAGMYLALTWR